MSDVFSYRNLRVYQQAKEFVVYVYRLLKQFPKEEQYALCDQLRRAVISIPSNIAEGMGHILLDDKVHKVKAGDSVTIPIGYFYTVKAITEIIIIEVQMGNSLKDI